MIVTMKEVIWVNKPLENERKYSLKNQQKMTNQF